MISSAPSYHGYRFPPDIIAHAVWLYFRFSLSFRDVEDLLAQRGITVAYETIRRWCRTFGRAYARRLRHRRGRLGDTWHLAPRRCRAEKPILTKRCSKSPIQLRKTGLCTVPTKS